MESTKGPSASERDLKLAWNRRPRVTEHDLKMEQNFAYMCEHTTKGYLKVSLFPTDYDDLTKFECAFRDVAAQFDYVAKNKLREMYSHVNLPDEVVELRILIRFLSAVMDACERRGFRWPSSMLRVKSKLQREAEELKDSRER
jgi:hypothetical protein